MLPHPLLLLTANDITEKLLACIHKNGFYDHFFNDCFVAFVCDGESLMLGRRAGVVAQLCARFSKPVCVALLQSSSGIGTWGCSQGSRWTEPF